jgi:hypothetical protein
MLFHKMTCNTMLFAPKGRISELGRFVLHIGLGRSPKLVIAAAYCRAITKKQMPRIHPCHKMQRTLEICISYKA